MAVNGNQPVNVDNLKTALQRLSEEVLWAGYEDFHDSQNIWLPVGDDITSLTIQYMYVLNSDRELREISVDVSAGSSATAEKATVTVNGVQNGLAWIGLDSSYLNRYYALRILGKRSGGGQLLADLIKAVVA